MKKPLQSFLFLLFVCCWLGGLQPVRASHLLGCDMTYTSLGANRYRVKFRLYRDCSGIPASGFTLECRNGGCTATATVTAALVQQGATISATPLCPSTPGTCANPSSIYPLYDFTNYEATVTLPPGQWTMSTNQNARPSIANIVNPGDLYAEAFLDNRNGTNGAAVANTSPQFDPQDIPIQYVCVNQRTTFGFSSIEPDGDSLVYSLAAPLSACGTPITYAPYPGANAGGVFIITRNPLCILEIPGLTGGTLFTPTLPIPVATDTTGQCPIRQGVPYFGLNQNARTVTFTPNRYVPVTSAADGANKYQVVVAVNEYRRVNGVRRIVGRVRREAVLIVINCGNNTTPNPVRAANQTVNSNTATINTADTTQINVYSCSYSRVSLDFTDPDNLRIPSAHQILTVTVPQTINTNPNYLDSGDIGVFSFSTAPGSTNGSEHPRGTFIFQPSSSAIGRTIRINIKIEDNACPVKGLQNRVIVIKILKGNFATAVAAVGNSGIGNTTPASGAICAGGALTLQGRVIRPDSVRQIATNVTQPQVYNYQWTVRNNGNGLPAVTNTQNIVVSPTATTRYYLNISPALGFSQGLCSDTSSILVRVVPPPVATAKAALDKVCAGAPVVLTATAVRPAGAGSTLNDTYTYRWAGPGLAANTTGQTLTVRPTTLGINTYTLTASGASPYGCAATATAQVEVVASPRVAVTTNNAYICPGGTATLQATATAPQGFTDTYTFRFNSANGLAGSDENKANPTVRPTVTTRYYVTGSGNPITGCADTASVLVRVLPGVKADFITADSVGLNGQRTNRPPVIYTFRNTSVVSGQAQGSTTTYKWTYERIRDIANNTVSGTETAFGNGAVTPAPLQLGVSGYYRIRLTATVSILNGGTTTSCETSVREHLLLVPDLEVPNVITPNGDGKNDVFKISTASTTTRLEVFNRWGRKVYEQSDYQNNWGGDNQPAGVYYYLLTLKNGSQSKGWLEVMR